MIKKYFLQKTFPLNRSHSKAIWLSGKLVNGDPQAELLLFGDNRGIKFDRNAWRAFSEKAQEMMNYCSQRGSQLEFEIGDEHQITYVNGRQGNKRMISISQLDKVSKEATTLVIANPSVDRLFALQPYIECYLAKFERSREKIKKCIAEINQNVQYETCDVDLAALKNELLAYPEILDQ
jgi:hypothetical protein